MEEVLRGDSPAESASAFSRQPTWLWWSLPDNFSTYDEYRSHLAASSLRRGSGEAEILTLLALGPFCVLLSWGFVAWNLGGIQSTTRVNNTVLLCFEFLFILFTSLAALTVGSESGSSLLITVVAAAVGFVYAIDRREGITSATGRKERSLRESFESFRSLDIPPPRTPPDPHGVDYTLRQSVTEYRSLVLIVTVICILAVDFPAVFPDRFHKSATFGTSIMDLGVGGFVVANGLVAKEARSPTPDRDGRTSIRTRFLAGLVNLRQTFRSCFVLAFLGLVRAAAVAVTGYHVSVTEYGVHWNFFLTLAAVKLIASLVFTLVPHRMAWVMGASNLIAHQASLSLFGLQRVVLFGTRAFFWTSEHDCPQDAAPPSGHCARDPRRTLIDGNREGIFSVWGFLSLYFFSVQLGRCFFRPKSKVSDWIRLGLILLVASASSMIAYLALIQLQTENVLLPSRRIANASYVLWTLANCCFPIFLSLAIKMLIIFLSFQHGLRYRLPESVLMRAINNNPLSLFLVANLLTGFANLVFPTLLMGAVAATVVLLAYLVLLTLFVYTLLLYRIKLA